MRKQTSITLISSGIHRLDRVAPRTIQKVAEFLRNYPTTSSRRPTPNSLTNCSHLPTSVERWAQHWLDVIRWAETNGSGIKFIPQDGKVVYQGLCHPCTQSRICPTTNLSGSNLVRADGAGAGEALGLLKVAGPHAPAATVGQEPSAIRQALGRSNFG